MSTNAAATSATKRIISYRLIKSKKSIQLNEDKGGTLYHFYSQPGGENLIFLLTIFFLTHCRVITVI